MGYSHSTFLAGKFFSRNRLSYARLYQSFIEALSSFPILEGVRLHDLRHTWATECVGLISLEQLRALMGHENIQTTLQYQKVTSLKAQEAAQIALNLLHQ
jgi:integrase/recombinase XerD